MSTGLIIYLLGCCFAFIIGMIELIHTENSRTDIDGEPQYGIFPVIIMLSWVIVAIWIYNKYFDKSDE